MAANLDLGTGREGAGRGATGDGHRRSAIGGMMVVFWGQMRRRILAVRSHLERGRPMDRHDDGRSKCDRGDG